LSRLERIIKNVVKNDLYDLTWLAMTGGNFSMCKDLFWETGGFDIDFGVTWGCEDFELGYRLHKNGLVFAYHSDCVNFHMTHFRKNVVFAIHSSIGTFYQKHYDDYIRYLFDLLSGKFKSAEEYIAYVKNIGETL
jgi:hypothetical protein